MDIFFYISIFPSGNRQIISYSSNQKYDVLYSLIDSIAPIQINNINEVIYVDDKKSKIPLAIELIQKYRDQLESNPDDIFENDYSLRVYGEKSIIKFTWLEGETIELETDLVLEYFKKYLEFFLSLENCEIPGLLPESKLESWVCVPKEYVKEEYFIN